MTETIHVGDTVQGLRIMDFPILGAVTDGTKFLGELGGSGLFSATALKAYAQTGVVTSASLTAEINARIAGDAALTASVATFRRPLSGNTTWYVSSSGSDANDGLTTGAGAFLTIQHAVNAIQALYDGRGFTGTLSVANGTYNCGTGVVVDGAMVGFSLFTISCASPASSVTLTSTQAVLMVQHRARITLSGGFLLSPGAGFSCVVSMHSGDCHIGGITLAPSIGGSLLFATRFGYMEIDTDIHVANGTSGNLIQSSHSGNFRHSNGAMIQFDSNHNFSDCTLLAYGGEIVITAGAGFNLNGHIVTAHRYRAVQNMILWALGTQTSIPGTTDGAEQMGGRYVYGTTNASQWGGTISIDMAVLTAGDTTVVTGAGFLPGTIDFLTANAAVSGPTSIGKVAATYSGAASVPGFNFCVTGGAVGGAPLGSSCIGWSVSPGNSVAANVSALGSDGFTLTWAKAGSPTGTLTIYWIARRGV